MEVYLISCFIVYTYIRNKWGILHPSFQSFPVEALEELVMLHFACPRSAAVTSKPLVRRLFKKLPIHQLHVKVYLSGKNTAWLCLRTIMYWEGCRFWGRHSTIDEESAVLGMKLPQWIIGSWHYLALHFAHLQGSIKMRTVQCLKT